MTCEPRVRVLPGSTAVGERVTLGHGSGGRMSADLIREVFLTAFGNDCLNRLDDSARLDPPPGRLAFSTDTFVVDPIFFPGGDIGDLAVNGTVNDLAMSGAVPRWLSAGFIIEEGFPLADLERICASMGRAAGEAGVEIVTGDTKVVGRGGCDRIFINTAGIGVIAAGFDSGPEFIREGDRVVVSGPIGSHGMAVMMARGRMSFTSEIKSDTAALSGLVAELIAAGGNDIRAMRDATRGGVGSVLGEFAAACGRGIILFPDAMPVADEVAAACDLLGIDPLFVANEGRMVFVTAPAAAEAFVAVCRGHRHGAGAAVIGEVVSAYPGRLLRRTPFGSLQLITCPTGELLPRIC